MDTPGYTHLRDVLERAFNQASKGKGEERHANKLPFNEQPMQTIADKHGAGFIYGQIDKKALESHGMVKRGEYSKAVHELLGVINYAAGAVIHVEKMARHEKIAAAERAVQAQNVGAQNTERVTQVTDASLGKNVGAVGASNPIPQKDDCSCIACQLRRAIGVDEVIVMAESELPPEIAQALAGLFGEVLSDTPKAPELKH